MTPEVFGTVAAARYLGLSVATLKYHIRKGHVHFQRVGRSLVFGLDDLDEFLRCKRKPGRPRKVSAEAPAA